MNQGITQPLVLNIQSVERLLPVPAGFAEDAARSLGLDDRGALAMRLAAEEIFLYLCRAASPGNRLEITCTGGGYFVELTFLFEERIPLGAFNLTATLSPDVEEDLDKMGLLLASRSVDRFEMHEADRNRMRLSLLREKSYPRAPSEALPPMEGFDSWSITRGNTEGLKIFSRQVTAAFPSLLVPEFLTFPGKVVDMVELADFEAALAMDEHSRIGGGILWHRTGTRLVEFFGPYCFSEISGASLGEDLVEACLMAVGKSDAVGLYTRYPTETTPADFFEELGTLDVHGDENRPISTPILFRQIHEDPGATVWCHPELESFLLHQYERHFLPRRIALVRDMGESMPEDSLISTRMNRGQKTAVLKAVQPGTDLEGNVSAHMRLLRNESFKNILFEMDLGVPWQSLLFPALRGNGLEPRLVVPYGGEADLVIFQWNGSGHE